MQIQTKFHGEIEIQQDQLWNFPKGIPGFESEKEFALLPIEGNPIFQVLQSTTTEAVAFIVTNPYTLSRRLFIRYRRTNNRTAQHRKTGRRIRVSHPNTQTTIRNINHQSTSTTHLPTEQQNSKTNDHKRQPLQNSPHHRPSQGGSLIC